MKASGIEPARIAGFSDPELLPKVLRLPDWLFRLLARRMLAIDPGGTLVDVGEAVCNAAGRRRSASCKGQCSSLAERTGTPAPLLKRVTALVRVAEAAQLGSPGLAPEQVAPPVWLSISVIFCQIFRDRVELQKFSMSLTPSMTTSSLTDCAEVVAGGDLAGDQPQHFGTRSR